MRLAAFALPVLLAGCVTVVDDGRRRPADQPEPETMTVVWVETRTVIVREYFECDPSYVGAVEYYGDEYSWSDDDLFVLLFIARVGRADFHDVCSSFELHRYNLWKVALAFRLTGDEFFIDLDRSTRCTGIYERPYASRSRRERFELTNEECFALVSLQIGVRYYGFSASDWFRKTDRATCREVLAAEGARSGKGRQTYRKGRVVDVVKPWSDERERERVERERRESKEASRREVERRAQAGKSAPPQKRDDDVARREEERRRREEAEAAKKRDEDIRRRNEARESEARTKWTAALSRYDRKDWGGARDGFAELIDKCGDTTWMKEVQRDGSSRGDMARSYVSECDKNLGAAEARKREAAEEARRKKEAEEVRRREDERKRAEEARRKAEEETRKRDEEERKKQDEENRRKDAEEESKRQEEERRKKQEEEKRKKQQEEDRKKHDEENRKKQEEEDRKKQDEEERRKKEEDERNKTTDRLKQCQDGVARGQKKEDKGDLAGAIAEYSAVLKLDDKYSIAWARRGWCKSRKGDFDGAIDDCTEAIDLDKNLHIAWAARGEAKCGKGDLEGGVADYERALKLAPADWKERKSVDKACREAKALRDKDLNEEAKRKADEERAKKEEAQRKADEAKRKADEEAKRKAAEEAQRKADEAKRKADDEAKRKAAEEAQRKADEAKRKADDEAKRKADDAARRKEAEEAKRKADEAKRKADDEAKREADEKAARTAEEVERRADEVARRKAEDEAKRKAAEEAQRKADEAKRKADEEAKRKPPAEDKEKLCRDMMDRLAGVLDDYREFHGGRGKEQLPDGDNAAMVRSLTTKPEENRDPFVTFGEKELDKEGRLLDSWGNPFVYRNHLKDWPKNKDDKRAHNKQGADIYSFGPDGKDDGGEGDDIVNWKKGRK